MSETPDPKPSVAIEHKTSEWRSPQVMLPIIATISTILVAVIGVIPSILEANKPPALTPTPIVIAIIATPVSATNVPLEVVVVTTMAPSPLPGMTDLPVTVGPTNMPAMPATAVPTDVPGTEVPVDAAPTAVPNVTLFYDQDSFTMLNGSGNRISLEGIVFKGPEVSWDIAPFGGLMKALPHNKCLRMRDATVGNRQPPSECGTQMYGFLEIGPKAIFWRGAYFDVVRDSTVIATCQLDAGTCPIYVEPQ